MRKWTDMDEFELLADQASAAGFEIKIERRKNDWWCTFKHPKGWRYFGATGDTAQQSLLDAWAKAELAMQDLSMHDGVRL